MNWTELLNTNLFGQPTHEEDPNRPHVAQDFDRLVFSAPFRRLANKTQVHPLHSDDHLHHRLIHSIETSSVGRSLGIEIANWLFEKGDLSEHIQKETLTGAVQAACIAHDIGNPPFGHSGEAAIGEWFEEQFSLQHGLFGEISREKRPEFEKFEGNAQGFRLITRLEMYRNEGGMRLSNVTLGAFTKYPTTAFVSEHEKKIAKNSGSEAPYVGLKKFGVFEDDLDSFAGLAYDLGLLPRGESTSKYWCRHPLVFLVEAADDICYQIIDLEDAYVAGEVPAQKVQQLLEPLFGGTNRVFPSELEKISYYRARAINSAIPACVEAFKQNYAEIMAGQFSKSLVEVSTLKNEFQEIKKFSNETIFTAARKTRLEVSGRNTIQGVLKGMLPLFEKLGETSWNSEKLDGYYKQLYAASQVDLRDVDSADSALHALTDYVSGMTDRFAVKMHRTLSGLPD